MADDLRVQAQLITATFELVAVRSVRGAVRVNVLKMGGREGPLGNIENPKPPPSLANFGEQRHGNLRDRVPFTIDASIARVRAVDATPRCECRGTPRATDAAAPLPDLIPTDQTLPASDAERASGLPARHASPLAPPWALPLPIDPPPIVRVVVKCDAARSDQGGRGVTLDVFV